MKKQTLIFVLVFMILLLVGCPNNAGGDKNGGNTSGVVFDSFTPASVSVKNNTGERLVAFKGEISASALISGVPAHASNHGLKKDSQMFSGSGDFALLFLQESVYIENKNDLSKVKNAPFARVYAFYNASGTNDNVYEISSKSGGNGKLVLNNNSAFNVEIRLNGPQGEVLGYISPYTVNTTLSIEPGDYTLYPVFKKYIARDNEIYSVVPRFNGGVADGKPFSHDIGPLTNPETWNVGTIWDASKMNLSAGGFYLTINNQSGTGVRLLNGSTTMVTETGFSNIASGKNVQFFIPFTRNADGTYPESVNFAVLKIGSTNYPFPVTAQEFERDKMYTINVTGADSSNLVLSEVSAGTAVDLTTIFDL